MIGGIFATYEDYLISNLWREKSKIMISNYGCCQMCGVRKTYSIKLNGCIYYYYLHKNTLKNLIKEYCLIGQCQHKKFSFKIFKGKKLVVHHKTYENVGNEKERDLIVVCDQCHINIHKKLKVKINEAKQ